MNQENQWESVGVLTMSDADSESNFKEDTPSKIFGVRTYIPRRTHSKYFQPVYIGLGILALIIVIIISFRSGEAFNGSASQVSEGSDAFILPRGVILAEPSNFWSFDFETENFTQILETNQPIGAFDVYSTKSIFWNDVGSSKIISFHTSNMPNATHDNLEAIFSDERTKPKAMAMDHLSGNLYVLDDLHVGKLFVLNVHTKHLSLLMTDINDLQEIVIDSSHGLIFILQASHQILKVSTNGTLLGPLLSSTGWENGDARKISSLALDRSLKRIYWVKGMTTIQSSNYDGRDLRTVISKSDDILSLAVYESHLFRLIQERGVKKFAFCKLMENGTNCGNHKAHLLNFASISIRAIVSLLSEEESNIADLHPCNQPNKGGCHELCLATSRVNFTCACSVGMQLDDDGSSCKRVSEFLLYTWDNLVRGVEFSYPSDKSVRTIDVFFPTPFTVDSTRNKGMIDFDYGLERDEFFYSDDNNIYVMRLFGEGQKQVLFHSTRLEYVVEDLAYDWVGDNLYYSYRSTIRTDQHHISVMNVRQGANSSKILASFMHDAMFGLKAAPYAIAVDPGDGSVFFSAGKDRTRYIMRLFLNGTERGEPMSNIAFVHEHRLLTLDYEERRVYWISSRMQIEHANYDGSNRTTLTLRGLEPLDEPKTIAFHRSWMYLSNSTSVWRLNTNSKGNSAHKIIPKNGVEMGKRIAGVRLFSQAVHTTAGRNIPEDVRHSCTNSPCEQLCFPALEVDGGPHCACRDGEKLVPETKKCIAE